MNRARRGTRAAEGDPNPKGRNMVTLLLLIVLIVLVVVFLVPALRKRGRRGPL